MAEFRESFEHDDVIAVYNALQQYADDNDGNVTIYNNLPDETRELVEKVVEPDSIDLGPNAITILLSTLKNELIRTVQFRHEIKNDDTVAAYKALVQSVLDHPGQQLTYNNLPDETRELVEKVVEPDSIDRGKNGITILLSAMEKVHGCIT